MTVGEVITLCGVCVSLIFGFIAMTRAKTGDTKDGAKQFEKVRSDVGYIREGIDDLRIDMRSMRTEVTTLSKDVVRIEQIAKSAQHRIDEHLEREHKVPVERRSGR